MTGETVSPVYSFLKVQVQRRDWRAGSRARLRRRRSWHATFEQVSLGDTNRATCNPFVTNKRTKVDIGLKLCSRATQNYDDLSAQTPGSRCAAHLYKMYAETRSWRGKCSHLARRPDCPDQASHGCHTTVQRPEVKSTTRPAREITRAVSGLSNRGRRGELQEASEMGRFTGEVETGVERVSTKLVDGRHALPHET